MKRKFSVFAVALGAIALGTIFAPVARAGCGSYLGAQSQGSVKPMAFLPGSGLSGSEWQFGDDQASIVGLWRFKFVSVGNLKSAGLPDGTLLDQGYSAWHSDKTEIMNSGRDPVTGDFCLGTWKQTGRSSFKLNHYAMNWSGLTVDAKGNVVLDPTTKQPLNTLIGPTNISEDVTIDAGCNSFQGTVTIENYDPTGKLLIRLTGKVTAVRLTVDSPGFVE